MSRFHAVRSIAAVGTVLLLCGRCLPTHADAQAGPPGKPGSNTGRSGDAARGKALFEGKGRCTTCHRVNRQGARVAPDLSTVGVSGTPEGLRRSLLDPTSAMKPINRPVRVVTNDGTVITGRRLNEDTHTVQLIDSKERLLSLEKSELKEYVIGTTSPMPSYKDTLTPAELDDVVAYLTSLKGLQ
jgi:putative heme-binding domain-containing protein